MLHHKLHASSTLHHFPLSEIQCITIHQCYNMSIMHYRPKCRDIFRFIVFGQFGFSSLKLQFLITKKCTQCYILAAMITLFQMLPMANIKDQHNVV